MTVTERDKKILLIGGVAVALMLVFSFWPEEAAAPEVVGAGGVEEAEQRLERVRQMAAQVPSREAMRDRLKAEVEEWESGLIRSETGQQAQAQVLQILREIGSVQTPPLEFRSVEIGQIRPFEGSDDYGEALVSITFDCAVEQLVNFLADLTARPEAVVSHEIRITPGSRDDKLLRVRMSAGGMVPRSLVPQQQGLRRF